MAVDRLSVELAEASRVLSTLLSTDHFDIEVRIDKLMGSKGA
jgi:hypothetical protein